MRLKVIENQELKVHYMRLHQDPFNKIKALSKTIEMRLNDEKRQQLNVGDFIIFQCNKTDEILKCQIVNLYKFSSFKELYNMFDKIKLGYNEDEECDYHDMEYYYTKERLEKYGVVGIEIKVLN